MESFFSAASPRVQRIQAARLPHCLPPGLACKVENLDHLLIGPILCVIPHLLLRRSTCPVCRQTLAVEEEVGYDGGDESEEGE